MINLHERLLPTSAGVEPATSWSPVGRRIQLSHRGRHGDIELSTLNMGISYNVMASKPSSIYKIKYIFTDHYITMGILNFQCLTWEFHATSRPVNFYRFIKSSTFYWPLHHSGDIELPTLNIGISRYVMVGKQSSVTSTSVDPKVTRFTSQWNTMQNLYRL